MTRTYDVVIAGGGIVGAACAWELVQAGQRAALVTPGVIGGGATSAGMGHLAVMDDSEAQFALTRYSQLLWKQLAEHLPDQAEYLPCGALWVAADEEEMAEVHRKHRFYSERQVPAAILDASSLADAEPNLRPGLAGGLLLSDDAVIYPPCAARFLVAQAQKQGLDVLSGRAVVEANDQGARLVDGSVLPAGAVIVATGAAAHRLVPEVPVQPRKGHLLITDRYPGFVHHQLIELGYLKSAHSVESDSVAFNVQPRRTGHVLIGSSRQFGVDELAVDPHMMDAMLRRAIEYMPAIGQLSAIRSWTGFRASTPDKLPLIGPAPGRKNLYLATGHEGLGISTSLATAKLLADIMLGRESAIDRSPYLPERIPA